MTMPTPENAPPGTDVVCILINQPPAKRLSKGRVYTIREHVMGKLDGKPIPGIRLQEIKNGDNGGGWEWAYEATSFRLLSLSGLDALLTAPAPAELLNEA